MNDVEVNKLMKSNAISQQQQRRIIDATFDD